MSNKDAYVKKLEAQLDEWNAEIDLLKAKADKASADAQIEYAKEIDELRSMRDAASSKLSEIKNAADDAWEDLKEGTESAWNSLSQAVKSATSKFK
ncbi:hypothetical protein C8R30_13118 [Nitrosomonas nitrosa]|uniref:coiled coil domain-containing protein n=1 Tax=Nitrosomonas nitrosa TaxID=52442 RepID=UPI000D305F1B|nr:coiled coil domain-containing protein [Nitrosomonas nitrosa]PTQ91512.1 hypothetical protein C8R30_13118 [Nitrosomonas nitrosa]